MSNRTRRGLACAGAALALVAGRAAAQTSVTTPLSASDLRFAAQNAGVTSLGAVTVPEPPNLATYVRDRTKLLQLGKALFWDQQLGSDGQACASCHFHAGADNRSKNQINPGFRSTVVPGGDLAFGNNGSGAPAPVRPSAPTGSSPPPTTRFTGSPTPPTGPRRSSPTRTTWSRRRGSSAPSS